MMDDEFWALLREKQSWYRRPPMPRGRAERRRFNNSLEPFVCAGLMRLDGIEYEAWYRSTEEIPLWLKNELKYLDVDINFHREVALKVNGSESPRMSTTGRTRTSRGGSRGATARSSHRRSVSANVRRLIRDGRKKC